MTLNKEKNVKFNFKAEVEFDGRNFHGFQWQPNLRTVQGEIETALFKILGEEITISYSGRTDAGVSAYSLFISFNIEREFEIEKTLRSLNNVLPLDVKFKNIEKVESKFNARFSVKKKVYLYRIYNSEVQMPLDAAGCHFVYNKLNISLMRKGAKYLLGEHDFSSFCSASCEKESKIRKIDFIKIKKQKNEIKIFIKGNGFLQHMVRIIVGSLIDVGAEKIAPIKIKEILVAKDRKLASKTAPAQALYLYKVHY